MAALLFMMTVVALSAILGSPVATFSSGTTIQSTYYGCGESINLPSCSCRYGVVEVAAVEGALDTCMEALSDLGYKMHSNLSVTDYPALNLTENVFRDMQFHRIHFENTIIVHVDKNFLGASKNLTEYLVFQSCPLLENIPKIDSDVLKSLSIHFVYDASHANHSLSKNLFSGTPALETLSIVSPDYRVLTVQHNTFRSLNKLQALHLRCLVRLRFGALHFTAPGLQTLKIGDQFEYPTGSVKYTVDADPGSFSGIPAGAEITLYGIPVIHAWSPSKFFNVLRGGAILRAYNAQDCGCDLAWIRYSSFLKQVDLRCRALDSKSIIPLSEHDFSDCPYHQQQSLHRPEL